MLTHVDFGGIPGPADLLARPQDGGEGNRTPDLLNAIQALSQLSYAPHERRLTACRKEPHKIPGGMGLSQRTVIGGRHFAAPSDVTAGQKFARFSRLPATR